jgi:hypothetical protein
MCSTTRSPSPSPGKVGLEFVLPSSSFSPSDLLFFGLEHVHVLSHTAGFAMEISIYKLLRFIVFFQLDH